MKRQFACGEIFAQPATGVDEHILHDVAGVNAALHLPIEPQLHHASQSRAVTFEQPVNSRGISLTGPVEQFDGLRSVGPHSRATGGSPRIGGMSWNDKLSSNLPRAQFAGERHSAVRLRKHLGDPITTIVENLVKHRSHE